MKQYHEGRFNNTTAMLQEDGSVIVITFDRAHGVSYCMHIVDLDLETEELLVEDVRYSKRVKE